GPGAIGGDRPLLIGDLGKALGDYPLCDVMDGRAGKGRPLFLDMPLDFLVGALAQPRLDATQELVADGFECLGGLVAGLLAFNMRIGAESNASQFVGSDFAGLRGSQLLYRPESEFLTVPSSVPVLDNPAFADASFAAT